ncbi:MAG: response regulator [Elusimicrobiota bacterium]|nr:response regulator [Elusimicrobiota bacterium]
MSGITGVDDGGAARGHVLVAEDDPQIRTALFRFMRMQGYTVVAAADGCAAVALARTRPPDIVLLDIGMPGKGGLEVLKELVPEMPDTGFIIITGNEDERVALTCLRLGAFDYLPKPADLDTLAQCVKAWLLARRPPAC